MTQMTGVEVDVKESSAAEMTQMTQMTQMTGG